MTATDLDRFELRPVASAEEFNTLAGRLVTTATATMTTLPVYKLCLGDAIVALVLFGPTLDPEIHAQQLEALSNTALVAVGILRRQIEGMG